MKKYLVFPDIIRVGLALVFLANSLMAIFAPGEFQDLISNSFLAGVLPVSVAAFVAFIGISDFIVAVLLISGWRTSRVAAYASVWLVGVISVIGVFSLDALEHLGFFAMAVALSMRGESIGA